jgi:hypothetical protein
MFDLDQLRNDLKVGIVNIAFTKTDGTVRYMKATLQESYLPEFSKVLAEANHKRGTAFAVWDVEAEDWRAFRPESLISVQVVGRPAVLATESANMA